MFKVSRSFFLALVLVALGFVLITFTSGSTTNAQRGVPANNRAIGLVYDGLGPDSACRGTFKVIGPHSKRTLCSHGPDSARFPFNVSQTVKPVARTKGASNATGGNLMTTSAMTNAVVCDGDGTTGKRIQVLYAHAVGTADNYPTYLASFQQWSTDADSEYDVSAAETGGSRHLRFVTDANCNPVINDVQLSSTGTNTFGNTVTELQALGYTRSDRKYLVFVDAHVYCGIATWEYDDQPGATNASNQVAGYARVDAGCWSGVIAAHEVMHTLGGVQLSAPHSDGNTHCNDGYDNMCDHSGHTIDYSVCPNTAGDSKMDCNHDDYYNTNPVVGSYIDTHWNAARSEFLIGASDYVPPPPPPTAKVDLLVTGKLDRKGNFTASDTFKANDTVAVRAHAVDGNGNSLASATLNLSVLTNMNATQCALTPTTDANGYALATCKLTRKVTKGTWQTYLNNIVFPNYLYDIQNSVKWHYFSVQ